MGHRLNVRSKSRQRSRRVRNSYPRKYVALLPALSYKGCDVTGSLLPRWLSNFAHPRAAGCRDHRFASYSPNCRTGAGRIACPHTGTDTGSSGLSGLIARGIIRANEAFGRSVGEHISSGTDLCTYETVCSAAANSGRSALLMAAWRVGAVICAPRRSVT